MFCGLHDLTFASARSAKILCDSPVQSPVLRAPVLLKRGQPLNHIIEPVPLGFASREDTPTTVSYHGGARRIIHPTCEARSVIALEILTYDKLHDVVLSPT